MNSEEFYQVGKVKDAHGLKGELYVRLFSNRPEWVEHLNTFRLVKPGQNPGEFKVKKIRLHKQGLIIWPEEMSNRNESECWKGADFLIPTELVSTSVGEEPFLREILGFEVMDKNLGSIGQIEGLGDNGAHTVLVVVQDNKEWMIPYVDVFVEHLDREARKLYMDLPEGLVEE